MSFSRVVAFPLRWILVTVSLIVLSTSPAAGQDAPGNGLDVVTIPSVDPNRLPSSGPYTVVFSVSNTSETSAALEFSCTTTGPLTCSAPTPSYSTVPAGGSVNVTVTYSTTSSTGSGGITLTAVRDAPVGQASGIRQVAVFAVGKGVPFFANPNVSNLDRGLCLTVGAGEAAGLSCGDLFVVHSMPAYRTLGRDRSLGLYYNSAAATGQVLIPARVMEPNNIAMPTTVEMSVTINGNTETVNYSPPAYPSKCNFFPNCNYADSFQVTLGRSLTGLATGYYPVSLKVRNIYSTSVQDSVVTGSILVVNRSASEYGAGWSLLGLEQILADPADSTRKLWLAGDGSIRVYYRGAGLTSGHLTLQSGVNNFSAANAVDGNLTNTAWTTNGSTPTTAYVGANLGAAFPQAVTTVRVNALGDSNAIYDIQYSDNATAWTTVRPGFKPRSGWNIAAWVSVGAHRYWRLKVANNNGAASTIRELSFGASNNFYGAPGDAPDSLVRFVNGGPTWYRRNLKHGAKVEFDETGRHRTTTNRVGAITTFYWSPASPGPVRLDSINVPPNSTPRQTYTLYWNSTTKLLDRIVDPSGRQLTATMTGSNLTRLADPDNAPTRFVYSNGRMTRRIYPRMNGDSAYTSYTYANNARVTSVAIQTDVAATLFATTAITPWDEKGLSTLALVDAEGLPTRVDGPLVGTGDAADIWVDQFGGQKKLSQIGLNTITTIKRDSLSLPALVTQVQYPHPTTAGAGGQIVRMSWNAAGNLTMTRDSTSHLGMGTLGDTTKVTTWTYGDATSPDSPTEVVDSVGGAARKTRYAYTSLGLTDSVIDPRNHRTKFTYVTSGPKVGLVRSVIERNVQTWHELPDSMEYVEDQTHRLDYDANGNIQADTSASGVVTSYVTDAMGRVTDAYDPLRTRTRYLYDSMNRPTQVQSFTDPVNHPNGVAPLASCLTSQVICADSTRAFNPDLADTLYTKYAYTSSGAVDSILDPRNVKRRFIYDARGQVAIERDDFGYERVVFAATSGLTDSMRLRSGGTVKFRHDNFGRRTAVLWPARVYADTTVPADSVVYSYDLLGRVLTATNSRGTISRTYYADGSVRTKKTSVSHADSLYFEYDAAGARTRMIANGRDTVLYRYGATTGTLDSIIGRLDTAGTAGAVRPFAFTYDELGRRRQLKYPNTGAGQITVDFYYDAAGVLRKLRSANTALAGTDRFDFIYRSHQVDPMGRILYQKTTCTPFVSDSLNLNLPCGDGTRPVTNRYNRRGELVYQLDELHTDLLRYDASGNLIHRYQSDGGYPDSTKMVLLANSNRLFYDSSWATGTRVYHHYDRDGADTLQAPALLSWATASLWKWQFMDGLGRLTGYKSGTWNQSGNFMVWQVRGTACRYDPDGQMYKPCGNAAPLLAFDGHNVTSTTSNWRFVTGPSVDDPLLGRHEREVGGHWDRQLFFVTDGNGRQFSVGDQDGGFNQTDYSPTQDSWKFTGGTSNSFSFNVDRFQNSELPGVSFFRNRAYDARTGRWTQEDPLGVAGGINLYQFNGNNPVMYSDPFGLCPIEKDGIPCSLTMGATAAVAGAASGCTVGATGGTFVAPGVGTLTGCGGGAVVGGGVGLLVGGTVGAVRDLVSVVEMSGIGDQVKKGWRTVVNVGVTIGALLAGDKVGASTDAPNGVTAPTPTTAKPPPPPTETVDTTTKPPR